MLSSQLKVSGLHSVCTSFLGMVKVSSNWEPDRTTRLNHTSVYLEWNKDAGISVSYTATFFNCFQVPTAQRNYLLIPKNLHIFYSFFL